ncbi:MAG: hypothetical protein J1E42_04350 [Akkermansiaceae bacterium]|nr:hypothetical protein [Akkermansiaceae bacterium]
MRQNRLIPSLLAAALLVSPLFAELAVDPIYQSQMVLQRGVRVPISGTSTSAEAVTVSFAGQKVTAKVKGKKWEAVLAPMEASAENRTLTITQGKQQVTLENVVVGEVWIASGQSNMLWRLDQTRDRQSLEHAEIPSFRFYHAEPQVHTGPSVYNDEQRRRLKAGEMFQGGWSVSNPKSCRRMSAVGWYFGKALQEKLNVPVGVVHVSLGGSEMLAWIPKSVLEKKYPKSLGKDWMHDKNIDPYWVRPRTLKNLGDDFSAPHPYQPGYLFENGIAPWLKFPVAGVIWYQGESDAALSISEHNRQLLTDLITGWRKAFKNPQMPFCMVQLPRIKDLTHERVYWPEFREVQSRVSRELPRVYCAVTLDLGTTNRDVHPPRKLEVGERLAALAASQVYGVQGLAYSGPVFARAEAASGSVALHFDFAEGLRTTNGAAPAGFELSADGKTYYPAEAELADGAVQLRCDKVAKPRFVRYAWSTFVEPNLVNADGLPTAPFAAEISGAAKR